jgi:hypothetical protein
MFGGDDDQITCAGSQHQTLETLYADASRADSLLKSRSLSGQVIMVFGSLLYLCSVRQSTNKNLHALQST